MNASGIVSLYLNQCMPYNTNNFTVCCVQWEKNRIAVLGCLPRSFCQTVQMSINIVFLCTAQEDGWFKPLLSCPEQCTYEWPWPWLFSSWLLYNLFPSWLLWLGGEGCGGSDGSGVLHERPLSWKVCVKVGFTEKWVLRRKRQNVKLCSTKSSPWTKVKDFLTLPLLPSSWILTLATWLGVMIINSCNTRRMNCWWKLLHIWLKRRAATVIMEKRVLSKPTHNSWLLY